MGVGVADASPWSQAGDRNSVQPAHAVAATARSDYDPSRDPHEVDMRPSAALDAKRAAVRELAGRYSIANPRVFGSVVHGTDQEGSDIDLLVDALPGTTLFDLGDLQDRLEGFLGVSVDLLTPDDLPPRCRAIVLAEARPL